MTTAVECPTCGGKVELPGGSPAGPVQCAGCGTSFTPSPGADEAGLPLPTPPEPKAAGPVPVPEGGHDWQRVRLGVGLVLAHLVIQVGILVFVAGIRFSKGQEAADRMGGYAALVRVGAEALAALGCAFCLAAPRSRGARGLAAVALGLMLAIVVVGAFVAYAEFTAASADEAGRDFWTKLGTGVGLLGWALFLAWAVVFALLLHTVARLIDDQGLARQWRSLLAVLGAGIVLLIVTVGINIAAGGGAVAEPGQPPPAPTPAAVITGLGGVVLLLVTLVWYIHLLFRTRQALVGR